MMESNHLLDHHTLSNGFTDRRVEHPPSINKCYKGQP